MTAVTQGGCAGVTVCMAFVALGGRMGPGKRETRSSMVKGPFFGPGWVTGKACRTVPRVSVYTVMLAAHFRLTVFVAIDTSILKIGGRVGVALAAGIPYAIVPA